MVRLALLLVAACAVCAAATPRTWGDKRSIGISFDATDVCPAVSAQLLSQFVQAGASDTGAPPLTKAAAAALACQLGVVISSADVGDANATDTLSTIYRAWRSAYKPHVWHVKPVGSGSEARYGYWLASLREIVATNSKLALRYWAGLNAYSDMTDSEFAANVLMTAAGSPAAPAEPNRRLLAKGSAPATSTLPTSVNHAAAGKVLPGVAFQAQCASSWAFASAAAVESNLLLAGKASVKSLQPLSAQHIMDCVTAAHNYSAPACSGGSVADAFDLAQTALVSDKAWTYRPAQGGADAEAPGFIKQCSQAFTPKVLAGGLVRISGTPAYTQVAGDQLSVLKALVTQPAVTVLSVDASFRHYAGGIWSADCTGATGTQALLLVGYDTTRAGKEFLLAKNSLGAGWGEGGFARIALADACGLYQNVYQPGTASPVQPAKTASSTKTATTKPAPTKAPTPTKAPAPQPAPAKTVPADKKTGKQ